MGSDPSQDAQLPPSPTYQDRDYTPEQIPPLRCHRGTLHHTCTVDPSDRQNWCTIWGPEGKARFNVEDIIIAGGVTVVQKVVASDSVVAVKIAVRHPREADATAFNVKYDAAAKRYLVTFEVSGFSDYLHGKPRLQSGYTEPYLPYDQIPAFSGRPAPLRPNAYDESREWVKSDPTAPIYLNYEIRNFKSREFHMIFALHEQTEVMCLEFFAQDCLEREDGGDWCEHNDQISHIEHLLLNKAHPKFVHDGDIFLKETFKGFAEYEASHPNAL